jgi:hypothetical protein
MDPKRIPGLIILLLILLIGIPSGSILAEELDTDDDIYIYP